MLFERSGIGGQGPGSLYSYRALIGIGLAGGLILWTQHVQDPDRVRDFMGRLGYTQIRMEGEYSGTCGRGDAEYPFHALSAAGEPVHGEVCAGVLGYFVTAWPDRPPRS